MRELSIRKYNFVYKTTNNINGRYYVGVHTTDKLNDGYLGSGNAMLKAIKKYGRKNFTREIIEMCESAEQAYELEALIVDEEWVDNPKTYNLRTGGYEGQRFRWSDEMRARLAQTRSFKGENNPNYGKGWRQAGRRNGRHRDNFKGDISQVSRNISKSLKATPLNKKENNPASKNYYIVIDGEITNIAKGHLYEYCGFDNKLYLTFYNSMKKGKPVISRKRPEYNGYQLFEGIHPNAHKTFGSV